MQSAVMSGRACTVIRNTSLRVLTCLTTAACDAQNERKAGAYPVEPSWSRT